MYKRFEKSWTKHLDFMVLDLVLFEMAFILAFMLRHGYLRFSVSLEYVRMGIMLALLELILAFLGDTYSGILRRGFLEEFKAAVKHCLSVMVVFVVLLYLIKAAEIYSRFVIIVTLAFAVVFLYVGRIILKKFIIRKHGQESAKNPLLVITTRKDADTLLPILKENQKGRYSLDTVVIIDENMWGQQIQGVPVAACKENIVEYVRSRVVEEIFLYIPEDRQLASFWMKRFQDMGITVHMGLVHLEKDEMDCSCVEQFGGYTVLSASIRMATPRQIFMKRLMDICGSIVGLIITGICFIFVAPIICIQSPGPIIFSQERIGKNGKHFRLYKFRSMYPDAEERKKELMAKNEVKDGMMFKIKDDPRIFPFGHFLRNTSIDEFPQFWNVLKGEMSLVGTRPPTVDEWEKYEYHHMKRLAMKPGITGLWQVSGRNDIRDFEKVVALDTKYISEWCISLDIKILFMTVVAVVTKKGAS